MKKAFVLLLASLFCLSGCDLLAPIPLPDSSESNPPEDSIAQPSTSSEPVRASSQESSVDDGPHVGKDTSSSLAGSEKEKIRIWVSEISGVADHFKKLATQWAEDNQIDYDFEVLGFTEADAATLMLNNVSSGADIYCFRQDQLSCLAQSGALSVLGSSATTWVEANNVEDATNATFLDGSCYAYPLAADNGYFMYYDESVVDPSHVDSLEEIIEDCQKAGTNFSMEFTTSGWYLASFFMSCDSNGNRLCHSNWTVDSKGKVTGVDDTYDSNNGIIAARGAQHLVQSGAWESRSSVGGFAAAKRSSVVITGTWSYDKAKEILGDNLGIADLPSYTVDGKSYHLGSYSGYKLMGIKPQVDAKKAANLNKLVQYLTSYEAEMTRLTDFDWVPSNEKAQASDEFKSNPAFVALAEQNRYATPQGPFYFSWWDIVSALGSNIKNAKADDKSEIKAALDAYKKALDNLFSSSKEERRAFSVIGQFAIAPSNDYRTWGSDLEMTEYPANTWTSPAITLTEGDQFKCRQGEAWDVAFGSSGSSNYIISATEAGPNKKIKLVTTVDSAGSVTSGTISIIDA